MTHSHAGSQWYARRNGTVRGPFADEHMVRYILLGRIRMNDELSPDRASWRPARDYPQLFPQELLQFSKWEDYQRLVVARMGVDERSGQRRAMRPNDPRPVREERRVSADRRDRDGGEESLKHSEANDTTRVRRGADNRLNQPLRMALLTMLLMTLVLAYFSLSSR